MFKDKKNSKLTHGGIERRAFERHPLDLDAQTCLPGTAAIQHKIRDFCLGGMLLIDEQYRQRAGLASTYAIAQGDEIEIHFSLPEQSNATSRSCQLNARVVRHDVDSFGVAFIEPDLNVLQGLMELAKSYKQRRQDTQQPSSTGQVNVDLIAECTELVAECLTPLAKKTHQQINDSLFEQAKLLSDIVEQNLYFETLGILNNNKEKFIQLFTQTAIEHMAASQNGQLPDTNANSDALALEATELAIVEEEVLDNWLADTGTIESVQRTHNELLTQLARRLSELFCAPVTNDNNPYGPGLFTEAFQTAITSFGLNHKVALACHKAFKTLLVTTLGELYKKLNQHLVEKGILPKLTYEVPHIETPEPVAISKQNISASKSNLAPDNERDGSGTYETTSPEEERRQFPSGITNHNIYELVSELRTLKRQLHHHSGQYAHESLNQPVENISQDDSETITTVPLSTNEVLHTLENIESRCTELDREDFKALIYSSLSGGVDETGKPRVIAPRENQIIDVSNSIFDSILTDVQVPDIMHNWLARMELPVLKMAIEDDSLFINRNHLVRQVVNKIAQLGLLIGEEESEGNNGVKSALDWLVNLISTEFDGSLSVFERVSNQLDLLISAQDRKYEDQLQAVIKEFENKEDEAASIPDVESKFETRDAYEEWLRRARRLKEGDWVLFDIDTPNKKRLRAALISPHTGKIVFVDAVGAKERVIYYEELAELLYRGSAMPIEDANEPAMDRAQYSMLQELNEQLVHESTHDQLTGLINRREFEKVIGKALISSRHSNIRHALLFIDLDQFNVINSTYGYEAGDFILVEIAKIFSQKHGHDSVLARLGSDEFGLLLNDVVLEDALEIVEEYLHQVKEYKFMWEGRRVSIGTSIGLVSLNNQSESITSLMQAAESSCGIAKEMGGNRVQLYHSGQSRWSRRSEVVNWVSKIDEVLDQKRLRLRCQKIMPVAENNVEKPHYEILLVMVDEHGETVSIQDFIEAAEWSNRIPDIDRWVVNEALEWLSDNLNILDDVDTFSINLSGRSLSDERLVDYIYEKIKQYGVPADALCFEITETVGVKSLSDSAEFIRQIKETGCRFSLDDFGSGMSSYAYLKNLPVDYLKIDGTFVKDIKNSISDYAVVKSICEIGHFMGKRVIAEYAEDDRTVALLTEIGVDFVQGYAVEKPLMINELPSSTR